MVAEPELPDFDAMSQAELLAWLAELTRDRDSALPQPGETDARHGDWLDDAQPPADAAPADLQPDDVGLPPGAIDWLREIAAVEAPEELPDITDYKPPEQSLSLSDILRDSPEDDALAWLDKLAAEISSSPRKPNHDSAAPADYGGDFAEEFEDDESLDDLEDESLYSPRGKHGMALVAAAPGLDAALEAADRRTQTAESPARQADRLTQAFAPRAGTADLEAWYAGRIAALGGEQPTSEPLAPETQPDAQATALPPPGLAAAINSARAKVTADALDEALEVYETLLGTPVGLDWVAMDMRALIAQSTYAGEPRLHRLLGDALMRSGQLDEALDAYCHALSLL
ncbi:MAG: hypothetical protein OXE95_02560 [Chloroflexi bacterium]|nr:hypothetical protein [Chloroflexota bacterium]MCY4246445.1 hypothetical protein [Chloroflexota bacterium]